MYVELRRTVAGHTESLRFGPFREITYGGYQQAQVICDGKVYFEHDRMFGQIARRGGSSPDGEPDLWDTAVITGA